jgi:hypothetical protein
MIPKAMYVGSEAHGPKPYRREIGLGLGIFGLVIISSYALSITPVGVFFDWKYWAGFLGFASLGWVWVGVDSIPGKRKRSMGLLQSRLVVGLLLIIGGSLGSVHSSPLVETALAMDPAMVFCSLKNNSPNSTLVLPFHRASFWLMG